jgi:hypothetical protein
MYTLLELQAKTLAALKEIGHELNVLPEGDRRRRQSWIDAIAGVNPPLLQLLEVSPAASVDQVQYPIIETVEISPAVEVDRVQEPPIESKFGRIVYPKSAAKPFSQNEEARPQLDGTECADVHNRRSHPTKSDRDSSGPKTETLGSQEGDRVLAVARHRETGRGRVLPDQSIELVNLTEADRLENEPRMSQSAIAQIAKTSPGVEVDRAQELIARSAENIPGVEPKKAQEYRFLLCLEDEGDTTLWYDGKDFVSERWSAKSYTKRGIGPAKHQLRFHPTVRRVFSFGNVLQVVENSPRIEPKVEAQEPIAQAAKTFVGVEVDPLDDVSPPCCNCFGDEFIEDEFGLIKICQCEAEPRLSHKKTQRVIAQAVKTSPGVSRKTSTAHQLLDLFKSSAHIIEDSPASETEGEMLESTIAPAAENLPRSESDPNPIWTGIVLSDKFLARYSPPQPENIHYQADADGQLSLLNFEVESVDEPPDPDDFESLDAFREAIARWDWEYPTSSFDHCSDVLPSSVHSEPNSVHCKPPDPDDFDSMFAFWAAYDAWDEATDDDSKPLEISLDSFCEWAPCPADWYEPVALDGSIKVLELSPIRKSSITSDFFILTFGCWGDRSNRSDEPPDTGIFARLPKPKPPKFPPKAASQPPVNQVSRNYPETIPKLFHRVAAGSSTQPARSPPGGDAML